MPNHVDRLSRQNNGLWRHEFSKCRSVPKDSDGALVSSQPSLEAAPSEDRVHQHPSPSILVDASLFQTCTSGPFLLQSFKGSLSQFSGNSFSFLLLVSLLPFIWDLKFHDLGAILTEFSAGQFLASFFVLFVHLAPLGSTLVPKPSTRLLVVSPVQKSRLRRPSACSPTRGCNCSGIVLTREEEHVRFEFWKEIGVLPLPSLARH